jgi:steroid 5-alpha reductase family enzyme
MTSGRTLLTLLFQGSTRLTEQITLRKYPLYAEYQRTTSRLLPWRPGPRMGVGVLR